MRHPRRSLILLLALAATTAISSPPGASAQHIRSFTQAGHCARYLATGLAVDARLAQAALPEGFTVLEAGGSAITFVFAMDCTTSTDGGRAVRSVVSGVAVFVDPVRSPGGCQAYDWEWQDSRRTRWLRSMEDLGVPMKHVRRSSISAAGGAYEASVPADLAPWSATATGEVAGRDPLAWPLVSVHCHVGPRGLVRSTYDHQIERTGAGPAGVTLGDGPLWRRLGAASQEGAPALLLRFGWTGRTELL